MAGIQVADLYASLRADTAGFDAAMANSANTVAGLGKSTEGAIGQTRALGLALGVLSAGAMTEMIRKAADFQSVTQGLANNTNMGAAGLDQMRQASLKLAAQTGQDADTIAEGYMHVANHAYAGAAAFNIMAAAAKNAAAVGGDANENGNILSGILREMNVSAADLAGNSQLATRYMDVLHNAVANSNFTMKDFAEGSKRAIAAAASFGVPLSQVAAQLALLSEHGFPNVQNAATNWTGMLRALEKPTAGALKSMQALSRATGVDLVGDIAKLRKDGAFLPQFLTDIQKATGGDPTKLMATMPRSSYEQVLQALIRNRGQLDQIQRLTGAAQAGITLPGMTGTDEAFAAQQKTLQGQLKDLQQTFNVTAITIGTALLPPLTRLVTAIQPVVQRFADWAGKNQQLVVGVLAAGTAIGVLAAASIALGPALAVATGPVGILAAAGVALYEAWSHNLGGIQGIVAGMWSQVQPVFSAMQFAVRELQKAFSAGGFGGAFADLPKALAPVGTALGALGGKILAAVQSVDWAGMARTIAQHALSWGEALVSWVRPYIPRFVQALGGFAAAAVAYIRAAAPVLGGQLLTWGDAFAGWIRPSIGPMVAELGGLLSRLGAWIANDAAPVIGRQLLTWGRAFLAWVQPQIGPLVGALGGLLSRLGTWIQSDALPVIGRQLESWGGALVAWVGPKIPPLLAALGGLKDRFFDWLGAQVAGLSARLQAWGIAFSQWVVPAGQKFLQEWPSILNSFLDWIAASALKLGQRLLTWGGQFWSWIGPTGQKLLLALPALPAVIAGFIAVETVKIGAMLLPWAAKFVGWVAPMIPGLLKALALLPTAIFVFIVETATVLGKKLFEWEAAFIGWAVRAAPRLPGALSKIWDALQAWIGQQVPLIEKQVGQWATALSGWVAHAWPPLKAALAALPKQITDALGDGTKVLESFGKDLITGLIGGITSKIPNLKDTAGGVKDAFLGKLGDLFHRHSPSLVMFAFGQDLIAGMILGMQDRLAALTEAAGAVAGAAIAATAAKLREGAGVLISTITLVHGLALAAATPVVIAGHTALGFSASRAIAAGIRSGTPGVVQAVNALVTSATQAAQQLVSNFAAVAAVAAQRLHNLSTTGNINGVVAGTLAPVVQTVNQASITPTDTSGAGVTASQVAAIATGQGSATQTAALGQATDLVRQWDPQAWQQYGAVLGQMLAAGIDRGLSASTHAQQALYTHNQILQGGLVGYWQIKSPSKVMEAHGRNIVAGLVGGIRASQEEAHAAMRGLFAAPPGRGVALSPGAGGVASGPVSITVNVHGDAVTVQGHDPTQIGQALGDFAKQLVQAARSTGPGNRRLQPGVPNPVPGGGS